QGQVGHVTSGYPVSANVMSNLGPPGSGAELQNAVSSSICFYKSMRTAFLKSRQARSQDRPVGVCSHLCTASVVVNCATDRRRGGQTDRQRNSIPFDSTFPDRNSAG